MKLDEFLKAHEGEAGMAEKLDSKYLAAQGVALSDEELDLATGGSAGDEARVEDDPIRVYSRDSRGNETHWLDTDTGKIFYYACPRCKRVTHKGVWGYMFCDPCDAYWNAWSERRVYIN